MLIKYFKLTNDEIKLINNTKIIGYDKKIIKRSILNKIENKFV